MVARNGHNGEDFELENDRRPGIFREVQGKQVNELRTRITDHTALFYHLRWYAGLEK